MFFLVLLWTNIKTLEGITEKDDDYHLWIAWVLFPFFLFCLKPCPCQFFLTVWNIMIMDKCVEGYFYWWCPNPTNFLFLLFLNVIFCKEGRVLRALFPQFGTQKQCLHNIEGEGFTCIPPCPHPLLPPAQCCRHITALSKEQIACTLPLKGTWSDGNIFKGQHWRCMGLVDYPQ